MGVIVFMTLYWIWWIAGVMAGISLMMFAASWVRSRYYYPAYQQEVDKIFNYYWNRKQEDRLYAWYKVRRYLATNDSEPRKLKYVEENIRQCDLSKICGKTVITVDGEWQDEAAETMDRV